MGSPIVFHTAPPQPASNARITCSPLLAGGADASQKGFGLLMPAKSMLRSAMLRYLELGITSTSLVESSAQRRLMARAALRPSATALTTSFPPLMQSPPL